MEHLKEIVHYFNGSDEGLELERNNVSAIILSEGVLIDEIYATITDVVYFVCENPLQYEYLKEKYPGLNIVKGNLPITNLPDKSIDFIIVDSGIIKHDRNAVRNELKRISAPGGYSDVVILGSDINGEKEDTITEDFLKFLYAGSWYESKEFDYENNNVKIKTKVYHNPIGYNEEEFKAKEITDFVEACENYCEVIENYTMYSVRDFLYNVQMYLIAYYHFGFALPETCGSDKSGICSHNIKTDYDKINKYFHVTPDKLVEFIGKSNFYWSNYNPYPEDEDKETFQHNLGYDLFEIYEDIKSNLIVFKSYDIYDKQQALWQFKFDWQGHTGDHWTFAVRAIHWKLQDLEYEE